MRFVRTALACLFVSFALAGAARADLRGDIARCAQIADDTARLACFDAIVSPSGGDGSKTLNARERSDLETALQREFRFDPGLKTGAFSFRIAVSGDLQISRDTAASREVERLITRIAKAFGTFNGWGIDVTVHGASVTLSRGRPYTGDELAQQARLGLQRTSLAPDRYSVEIGKPAPPRLWDDGRIRGANEHIDIVITGLN